MNVKHLASKDEHEGLKTMHGHKDERKEGSFGHSGCKAR